MATDIGAPPRAARAGVFGIFGLNGFLLSMWVVHIPTITDQTGISKATLGLLILVMAPGALAGMQVAGPLADRFGSKNLTTVAALLLSVTVLGPGFAHNVVQLAIALGLFGFANGALDVSMNAQAVYVERQYGRPILAAFHALFSCGGFVGALLGSATLAADWNIRFTLALAGVIGLVGTVVSSRALLPRVVRDHAKSVGRPRTTRKVVLLGVLAFALLLSEGVANDWSALQMQDHLGSTDAVAALAFGAFSIAMTIGRFGADRVAGAFGPVAVLRFGTMIAAAGIALVMVAPWTPLNLLGWTLFGIGLAGGVPQIFTAAGNLSKESAGASMSRVFGIGYLGFLAGPSLIGWLTNVVSLTTAMAVPLACALAATLLAGAVRPKQPSSV
jgi:MFS family permease